MVVRSLLLLALYGLIAAAPLALRDAPQEFPASEAPKCTLAIELTDATTGDLLAGVISVRDEAGKRVPIGELLARGLGVEPEFAIHDWYLLPGAAKVTLPRAKLKIKALHGLETEFGEVSLDLTDK